MKLLCVCVWILISLVLDPESRSCAQSKINYLKIANEKFMNGEYHSALSFLDKEINENNSKNPQTFILRGDTKRFLDDYTGALNDYDQALKLNSSKYEIFLKKAIVYSLLKDYPKSIDNYNMVIRKMPSNSTAYCGRGYVKVLKKEYTEALKDFNLALKKDSLSVSALLGRVISEESLGDHKNAVMDFKRIYSIDPSLIKKDSSGDDFEIKSLQNIME